MIPQPPTNDRIIVGSGSAVVAEAIGNYLHDKQVAHVDVYASGRPLEEAVRDACSMGRPPMLVVLANNIRMEENVPPADNTGADIANRLRGTYDGSLLLYYLNETDPGLPPLPENVRAVHMKDLLPEIDRAIQPGF